MNGERFLTAGESAARERRLKHRIYAGIALAAFIAGLLAGHYWS